MVILPPMGIAVTVVNPSVMVALLDVNLPGTLSSELVKAMSTPALSWPPRTVIDAKTAIGLCTDVATLAEVARAITAPPVVIVPAAKVNTIDPPAKTADVVQIIESFVSTAVACTNAHVAVGVAEAVSVLALDSSTLAK